MILTMSMLANFLPLLLIAFGIVLSLLIVAWRRSQRLILLFTLAIFVSALVATSEILFTAPEQVTQLLAIDNYSRFAFILILLASIAVTLLSSIWLHSRIEVHDEYFILLQLVVLGAGVLVYSCHFASFFIGFELLSIALVGLVGYSRSAANSVESAFKYLILSACASSFMLLGIAFIYSQIGSLSFLDIGGQSLFVDNSSSDTLFYAAGFVLIIVGIAFKLSLAPFHLWTPDVYQGAPIPITLLLASVSKVAMFSVFLRFWFSADHFTNTYFINLISILAMLSILLGNVLALKQQNIKRLLAYSSIAHMGYLVVVLLVLSTEAIHFAWQSALFYLTAYVLATVSLFSVLQLTQRTTKEQRGDLNQWQGLFWQQRSLAILVIISILSLAGIPLSMGFIGKFYLLNFAVQEQLWAIIVTLIIGSAISLFYYLRVVLSLFESKSNVQKHINRNVSSTIMINIAVIILLSLSFSLGIYPELLTTTIKAL